MKGTVDYTCKKEGCEHKFELDIYYTPIIPAQVSGPPENCYPEEGGDFELEGLTECPKCNTPVEEDKARDDFYEKITDSKYDYEEPEHYYD